MNKLISTTLYKNANEISYESFVDEAIINFTNRVLYIYNLANKKTNNIDEANRRDEVKKKLFYTTDFYKVFQKAQYYFKTDYPSSLAFPEYDFKVNPKNINFETIITNVKDLIEYSHFSKNVEIIQGGEEDSKEIFDIKDIPQWKGLFGGGEFPFFTIYAFRLGNTEYFAYTIHR